VFETSLAQKIFIGTIAASAQLKLERYENATGVRFARAA